MVQLCVLPTSIGYFDLFDRVSYNKCNIYFLNAYSPALKYLVPCGAYERRYSGSEGVKYLGHRPNI